MSRTSMILPDGRLVVFGFDRPFNTLFAQLYDSSDPATAARMDEGDDEPTKTVGYHPAEQALSPHAEHGTFPADIGVFDQALEAWGIDGPTREQIGAKLAATHATT